MMRTYRGIVCEKKKRYMVFLTGNGEFLRGIPIGDPPNVGDEADFKLVASTCSVSSKSKQRFVGVVLVAAALLFLIISSLGPLNEKVMAYVQLEAETAMEFEVDQQGTVIALRYLNDTPIEPERLSEWKDQALLVVLDAAILELSVREKRIVVTTVYPTRESRKETHQIIGNALKEVSVKYDAFNWELAESTPKERKIANKKKMSIHQFKSVQNEKPINVRQPVDVTVPIKEEQLEMQKDATKKLNNQKVPPAPAPQKQMDNGQERSNRTKQQKSPSAEKKEQNPNRSNNGSIQSHKDKKDRPANSKDTNKHSKEKQGPPVKQKQPKPVNGKKAGTGPPSLGIA